MNIKPIETRYRGYRFRSRLEARWAVFFDKLGIKYRYEDEGYMGGLGNDVPYLPDFYLIDFDIYAEVKGSNEQFRKDFNKIVSAIDWNATPVAKGLLLLSDIPNPEGEVLAVYPFMFNDKGVRCVPAKFEFKYGVGFTVKPCLDAWWENADDCWQDFGSSDVNVQQLDEKFSIKAQEIPQKYYNSNILEYIIIKKALESARGARFEHGEHGL